MSNEEIELKCLFCGIELNENTDQVGFTKLGVFNGTIKLGSTKMNNGIVHLDCLPNYIQGLFAEVEVLYRSTREG